MTLRDRTSEFLSATGAGRTSGRSSAIVGAGPGSRIRPTAGGFANEYGDTNGLPQNRLVKRSDFARMASMIATDIQATTVKLENLGKLVQRKTLFDDRPVEISSLTSVIKQDIASLNNSILKLAELSKTQPGHGQTKEHSGNVVVSLQEKLQKTSQGFAKVLEDRTEAMRAAHSRREAFGSDAPTPRLRQTASSSLYAANGNRSSSRPETISIDFGTDQQQNQQMLLLEEETSMQYRDDRNQAMEGIQKTMEELGQIFQQLGTMIMQQKEQIQRIDGNVEHIDINIQGAQRELLKYYNNLTGNRWLMIKVFGVILFFFIIFVIFL